MWSFSLVGMCAHDGAEWKGYDRPSSCGEELVDVALETEMFGFGKLMAHKECEMAPMD